MNAIQYLSKYGKRKTMDFYDKKKLSSLLLKIY